MKRTLSKLDAYQAIAFITGFGLLTYELIASRLLAPTIGSSIYVWTSVIGVIIAALSLGYTIGGSLADKRTDPLDISWLLIMSSAGVLTTLILSPIILSAVTVLFADPRLQGLFASLLLFAPTSFVLGMISPYLAKLKNVSLKTTGSTIASLSALNAMGSITGTFLTGFIFMAYIGSSETLILVCLTLLASSWLILPRSLQQPRLAASAIVILIAVLAQLGAITSTSAITIDTPTSSYELIDATIAGRDVRVLSSGPGAYQSGVFLDKDPSLVFAYTKTLAKVVDEAPRKERILVLGGGAYTLPQHLARAYPKAQIDVVEIDAKLASVARKHFDYNPPANITDYHLDARAFLNQTDNTYDVVLVDVFSDTQIPFSVTTAQYGQQLRHILNPEGTVVTNFIGTNNGACSQLLGSIYKTYRQNFATGKILPLGDEAMTNSQNIIMAFSQTELAWLKNGWREYEPSSASLVLRDNFAPVEQLQARCPA